MRSAAPRSTASTYPAAGCCCCAIPACSATPSIRLSVYFCYRADGALALMIYEVRNTFGEIHPYVLPVQAGRDQRRRRPAAAGQAVLRFAVRRDGDALSFPCSAARISRSNCAFWKPIAKVPCSPQPSMAVAGHSPRRRCCARSSRCRWSPSRSWPRSIGRRCGSGSRAPAWCRAARRSSIPLLATGERQRLYFAGVVCPRQEAESGVVVGHAKPGWTAVQWIAYARADFGHIGNRRRDIPGPAPSGPAGARFRLEAATRHARRHAARRPHGATRRQRAGTGGRDEALQLRLCLAAAQRRRHRHRRSLSARRMGHARPDAVSLSVLRQSGLDADDARRQAADALRPDRPALVQPQHQAAGAPQHLRPLRHRQRLLFGVARSEHDLFLGPVRGRHAGSHRRADTTNIAGSPRRSTCRPGQKLLEIGCGWGGFAEYAAKTFGARVVGLTISKEQRDFAQARIQEAGLADKVEIRLQDYRDERDQLRPDRLDRDDRGGRRAVLAEIFFTVARPAAARRARRHPGHHHPGQPVPDLPPRGRLHPALRFPGRHAALAADPQIARRAVRRSRHPRAHFRARLCQDARDLAKQFPRGLAEPDAVGFDDRFRRLWEYYLAYCEAGFLSGNIDVRQVVFAKSS